MNHFLRPTLLTVSLSAIEHNLSLIKRRIAGKARMMAGGKGRRLWPWAGGGFQCGAAERVGQSGRGHPRGGHPASGERYFRAHFGAGRGERGRGRASVRFRLAQAVFDVDTLRILQDEAARLGVTAYAHLKIDTGMMRIGVQGDASWMNCWRNGKTVPM